MLKNETLISVNNPGSPEYFRFFTLLQKAEVEDSYYLASVVVSKEMMGGYPSYNIS